jgi:hypothetical protein
MTQLNQPSLFETDSWFPHSRPVLTIAEVAGAFAMSSFHVRTLAEQGIFVGAGINDPSAGRTHLRIERWSVIAWRLNLLAEQGQQLPFKESPQVTWWRAELLKRPKLAPCVPGRKLTASTTPIKKARKKKCATPTKKSPRTKSTIPAPSPRTSTASDLSAPSFTRPES